MATLEQPIEMTGIVTGNRPLTPTVFELTFRSEPAFSFEAGQYISVIVPKKEGPELRRAYSIASAPHDSPIELCVKLVEGGPGSQYLAALRPGDTFKAVAPYGYFIYKTAPHRDVVFISTGTGVAPFRSILLSESYKAQPARRVWSFLGVRTPDELLYVSDFEALGVRSIHALSQAQHPGTFPGRVTAALAAHLPEISLTESDFYLCGNGAMIKEVKTMLLAHGVQKPQIHQEIYFR